MAKTKIAVLWGLLIAMMIACAGIYAALKAREMNPYISSTGTYMETASCSARSASLTRARARRPPSSRTTWSRSMTES